MIAGPQGVGKSTVAQQLSLTAIDNSRAEIWGLPIHTRDDCRVLYLAMDRPRQVQRSFQRMVQDSDRERLAEQLWVWPGPLPFSVTADPRALSDMVEEFMADILVIDSLKDIVPDLTSDPHAIAFNTALQNFISRGAQVLVLHHNRKPQGNNKKPNKLADVYGSTWLTAGIGSVIGLWGKPGADLIEVDHLKQPAESIGSFSISHDRLRGITSRTDGEYDLLAALSSAGSNGLTLIEVALLLDGSDERPSQDRARRRLVALGDMVRSERGSTGGSGGGGQQGRWYLNLGGES